VTTSNAVIPMTDRSRSEIADAAMAFCEIWAEVLAGLPDDYACYLNCTEANAAADLLRACGFDGTAGTVIRAHAEHDEPGDLHYAGDDD